MPFDKQQSAYTALRDLVTERTRPLVGWVGAGLSAEVGLPGWEQLRDAVTQAGLTKARTMDTATRTKLEKQLNTVLRESHLWRAFSMLRDVVGATTFQDEIKRALAEAPRVRIPESYKSLWRLPIRGVINLNIDRIATRAFYDIRPNALPNEFTADQIGGMTHVLASMRPFVANLHGNYEAVSTWVFTEADLTRLMSSQAYLNFIRTCATSNSILFVGLSADDRAVGGHLEWFAKNGISTGPHFWLTERLDSATDRWSEDAKIRVIRYANTDGQHREVAEFFNDLLSYVPQEDSIAPTPVVSQAVSLPHAGASIPDAASLSKEPTETVRTLLNARAKELLAPDNAKAYEAYERFCDEYDEAIHRAWYVTTKGAGSKLLEYTLLDTVERGAFGQVYKAIDEQGTQVAIKVLNEEIRTNPDLLRSFRRGVKSMRILQQRHALGMVEYKDASEIPAFVAMEWINGPNLAVAVRGRMISDWQDILRVARELATIIRSAHQLPERVLHRDLRPANIMLKGFYDTNGSDWEVVVLDFDLSWHRGAVERSVLHSTAMGYLAPEQIQYRPQMSTRSAAVDSYGVGMTLYFMCTAKDPLAEQHRHRDWNQLLEQGVANRRCNEWRSLPKRVARLIDMSTKDDQSRRLDMGQIEAELSRLLTTLGDTDDIQSVELLAEEIATQAESLSTYHWNADRGSAQYATQSGLKVEVSGQETTKTVDVRLDWERTGMEDRKRLSDLINNSKDRAAEKLKSGGWQVYRKETNVGGFRIAASADRNDIANNTAKLAQALDGAIQQIRTE